MEIDIRKESKDFIKKIVFSEHKTDSVSFLNKSDTGKVSIDSRDDFMFIRTEEDAENLIKALQKAIELNWWK